MYMHWLLATYCSLGANSKAEDWTECVLCFVVCGSNKMIKNAYALDYFFQQWLTITPVSVVCSTSLYRSSLEGVFAGSVFDTVSWARFVCFWILT